LLDDEQCPLRVVLVGGEAIEPDLWRRLSQCDTIDFYNVYGPTECTVDATSTALHGDLSAPHIGRPMRNRRVYILGRDGGVQPIGVPGEIYIGGVGVARGYINKPQQTAERFVQDPFSAAANARMYRTGDLGRWRVDGTVEYLGRDDYQVKIRGFRIELGEIEARLLRHEAIADAAVIAREDVPGDRRLVAYIVSRDPGALDVNRIQKHLKEVLPDFMVPSAFVMMQALPLTVNGKLDRRALRMPNPSDYTRANYEALQSDTEQILAGLWEQILQVKQIGRHDDFFELGGHSLTAMKLTVLVAERFSVPLEITTVFRNPTIEQLAGFLERARSGAPQAEAAVLDDEIIL
jgi:acyl-coenzyme A synthetase/AMP-(fatty) acid ligase